MIHAIEVSPHNPGTVYFASTRYKLNDRANYAYKRLTMAQVGRALAMILTKRIFSG